MYYVYILSLNNGQFYTGYTTDLKSRILQHKQNDNPTTKRLGSQKLEFYASFRSKKKALEFEKYLKSSSGFAFRNKRLIER